PMSSPKITTMFGFFSCAWLTLGAKQAAPTSAASTMDERTSERVISVLLIILRSTPAGKPRDASTSRQDAQRIERVRSDASVARFQGREGRLAARLECERCRGNEPAF